MRTQDRSSINSIRCSSDTYGQESVFNTTTVTKVFRSCDSIGSGYIDGDQAKVLFDKAGLSQAELSVYASVTIEWVVRRSLHMSLPTYHIIILSPNKLVCIMIYLQYATQSLS